MAKTINRLDDGKIKNGKYDPPAGAKNPRYTHDGAGLYLRVTPGGTKTFLRRYFRNGRAHWLSLGTYPDMKLKEAREKAQDQGKLLRQNLDPIEEQQRTKAVEDATEVVPVEAKMTFREATEKYEKAHRLEWTNLAYRRDWLGAFKNHVFPLIGDVPIDQVDREKVKKVLERIWETKTKTAKDLRGRIAKVLGWAEKEKHRPSGPNPAAWKDDLEFSLAKPSAIAPAKPHEALPYKGIAKFMADLRAVDSHHCAGVGVCNFVRIQDRRGSIRAVVRDRFQDADLDDSQGEDEDPTSPLDGRPRRAVIERSHGHLASHQRRPGTRAQRLHIQPTYRTSYRRERHAPGHVDGGWQQENPSSWISKLFQRFCW